MSLPVNKKSFNITNRHSKAFSLLVAGFQFATTLIARLRLRKVNFVFNFKSTMKAISTIRLRRVRFNFGVAKLITSVTQTISARRVRFTLSIKERGKVVSSIVNRMPIVAISKATVKAVSTILLRRVRFVLDPTIAQFFTLGYYDPDTLGDWDAETLGTMDYVEV